MRLVLLAAGFVLGATVATGVGTAASPPWPPCVARTAPVHIGVREVARSRRGRLVTLTLASRAMGDDQPVDVLLPRHYDRSGRTRYPVLYLLHGAGGSYRSWVDDDDVTTLLGDLPVIAVMPDGTQNGLDGGYSDWFGLPPGSSGVAPAWESFHIRELLPFIDAHFPTRPGAAGRAIAGISMGGGGAAKYAASYPGTFGYVGAFSGETNPLLPVAVAFQTKTCKWGDPAAQPVRWRDNDATAQAANLRGVRVFVRSGDGTPGPFDSPTVPADPTLATIRQIQLVIEYGAHLENEAFAAALRAHRVAVDARFFPGSHSVGYWKRDTRAFVAWLAVQLRHPPRTPRTFTVASAHRWFTAWGWRFDASRGEVAFVHVHVGRDAISARGGGRLRVVSPARYRPGSRHRLRVGSAWRTLRADRAGRLVFALEPVS